MNLTKFQINAVKSMARGLAPLQRKLDRIHAKELAFMESIATEKDELEKQINQINAAIETYTGGLTVNEVLNPESTVTDEITEGEADETAQVDMTEIIPTIMEEPAIEQEDVVLVENLAEMTGSTDSVVQELTSANEEAVPFWDINPAKVNN